MRNKIGLGIVAVTVMTTLAFSGAACTSKDDSGEKESYTVTFDSNEGVFSNGGVAITKSVKSGDYATCDEQPTRDDYFFYGWLIEADDTEAVDLSSTAIVKDTTFYAGWVDAVNITYYYNYVGAPDDGVYLTDKAAHGSLVTEPTKPAREDYSFDRWTIDADGYNEWAFATDRAMTTVSMYAQWTKDAEASEHTVTLRIGGDTTSHTVANNGVFAEPEAPEMDGYDFIEWRVGSLSGEKYDFGSVVTSDLDLYAYFEEALPANKHRITYILDDGTSTAAKNSSANPTVFTEGEAVTLGDPTRDCYTFGGWYKDPEFATKVTTVGGGETNNVTLYAKWEYNYPFFVTGDHVDWKNYPTIMEADAQKEECAMYPLVVGTGANRTWDGKSYVAERVYLLKTGNSDETGAKIIGYSATGTDNTIWFGAQGKTSKDTNIVVSEAGYYDVTIKVINGNSIEPPALSLRKFTASFVLDKSEIAVDDQAVNDGGLVIKPIVPGGSVVWYVDPQRTKLWHFESDRITSDTTLYGVYSVKSYIVVYANLDHLTWKSVVTTVKYGETLDLGYTLDKGYTQSRILVTVNNDTADGESFVVTGLDEVDVIVVNISGNIFLNSYTVTFKERDDTDISSTTVKHGASVTAPSPEDLTGVGERFIGWRDRNDNDKTYTTAEPNFTFENIEGDMTLFAVYEDIPFTVTFNSKGGSPVASQTGLLYDSRITEPTAPTKNNGTFIGWYTDSHCTDGNEWNFATDRMPAHDVTLYAKWELNDATEKYTVSFLYQKDGEQFSQVEVGAGDGVVSAPSTSPTRTGYIFDKWFDADTDGEFDFDSDISGDKTLYATWRLDAPSVTLADISGVYTDGGYALTATASHPVSGVTYSYKWYKDGTVIGGATGSTYTVTNVADSGSYSVEVTASDGSLVSQSTQVNATVSITKATLPSISDVAFKDGDAYTNTIVFKAGSTSHAEGYTITVLNGTQTVFTQNIAINAVKEVLTTVALDYVSCSVRVTYYGVDDNFENVTGSSQLVFCGNGTADCPFVVRFAWHLPNISKYPSAHFKQTMSASATGVSSFFTDSAPFTGVYDGQGYSISNVTGSQGLFGYIGAGGVVKNLTVKGVSIDGKNTTAFVGGIAAENSGTITGVTVGVQGDNTGTIDSVIYGSYGDVTGDVGNYAIGGIVGKNSGTVSNCVNNARLWGNKTVGGIVGYNMENAAVTGCVNNGLIGTNTTTAATNPFMSYAGGLVGNNVGTISQSINNGNVTAYKSTSGSGNSNDYYGGLAARNDAKGKIKECINNATVRTDYAAAGLVSRNYGTVEYCINRAAVNARNTASSGMATGNGQILYCVMIGTANLTNSASSSSVGGTINCSGSSGSTVKNSYYKNASEAPGSKATAENNAVYDDSTPDKINTMLETLNKVSDKFALDETNNITLAFLISPN